MIRLNRLTCACILAVVQALASQAQQRPAEAYDASVDLPAYPEGTGPLIYLDHAHNNFHRLDGRFAAFAAVARNDGFRIEGFDGAFTSETLANVDTLIIANAVSEVNRDENNWTLPNPSAFTEQEINALAQWVQCGGALLLIADHMPFDGAASKLAERFGFQFTNGYVLIPERKGAPDSHSGSRLREHPILSGRDDTERVDTLMTFIGSAFLPPKEADPVIVLEGGFESLEPAVAWELNENTPSYPVDGWSIAATRSYGNGRIAVYAEAGMLTAQLHSDGRPMGFNAEGAEQNTQFIRNTLHWLTGLLPVR